MAAIIFDFDGTISDSFDYVADFLASTKGLPPLDKQDKDSLRHMSMVGMARRLGYRWWQAPFLFLKGRRRMNKAINDLKPFEGIESVIRHLHAEGHELFILSNNSRRNIRHFLNQRDLDKCFVRVYGGVGIFSKAPALSRLFKDQNLDKEQGCYIGDELKDVESAHAIGLRVIAVSWGFASRQNLKRLKPTKLVDTPQQLLRILEDL